MKTKLKKYYRNKNHPFIFLSLFIIQIILFSQLSAQTFSVNGNIVASSVAVQNASVTFIDKSDTTKKYFALTDALGNYQVSVITSVKSDRSTLPTKFQLDQNYPNPFSSSTSISYKLNQESDVHITIYDVVGREVRKFTAGEQTIGIHSILWNGLNNFGERLATGIYFYRLQAGGESKVKKMIYKLGEKIGFLQQGYSSRVSQANQDMSVSVLGGNYTVRIENTNNTSPMILHKTIDNVTIQSNTTINFVVDTQSPIPVADIYLSSTQQLIRGFGAANIVGWRPDMTDSEIETAFGTGNGQLGFSILRLRIPPDSTSWNTYVHAAKKAYDKGVLVFASPWTPPASMKTNNNTVGGELKQSSYADYATHLKKFADYMAANGVNLYTVSLQNEPDANVTYESCTWNGTQFLNFMKNNAPSIGTRIMMPESQNFVRALSDPTLNDPVATANVSIIAGHIYGGGLYSYPLAASKGKEIWMTEHITDSQHSANTWSYAMDLAKEMNDVMQANMNAYVWWYIVRYYGPIADGEKSATFPNESFSQKGEVTKRGYVMSQFARFIRPGFYKIDGNGLPQRNVYVSSYKDNNSKVVIVVLNTNSSPVYQTFSVQNGTMTTFTPYTTSTSKNCAQGNNVTATNGSFTVSLEPSSITTFVSN